MKKFVIAAVAASLVATPAMAQQYRGPAKPQPRPVVVVKPQPKPVIVHKAKPAPKIQYRNWQRGQRFDHRYARNYRQIDYRQYNRQYRGNLKAPPRGYQYVQSGNDILLVAVASGIIAAIFGGMIR